VFARRAHNDNAPLQATDRFAVAAFLVPVGTALVGGTIASFSFTLGIACIFIAVAPAVIWLLAMATRAMDAVRHGCWRRAALLLLIALSIVPLSQWAWKAGGDYLHLALLYPRYVIEIEHGRKNDAGRIAFDWDESGLDPIIKRTLVYDPTDATADRVGRVRLTNEQRIICRTKHLLGHFYISEVSW